MEEKVRRFHTYLVYAPATFFMGVLFPWHLIGPLNFVITLIGCFQVQAEVRSKNFPLLLEVNQLIIPLYNSLTKTRIVPQQP